MSKGDTRQLKRISRDLRGEILGYVREGEFGRRTLRQPLKLGMFEMWCRDGYVRLDQELRSRRESILITLEGHLFNIPALLPKELKGRKKTFQLDPACDVSLVVYLSKAKNLEKNEKKRAERRKAETSKE